MVWFSKNIRFPQSNSQTYVKFSTPFIMKKSLLLYLFVLAVTSFSDAIQSLSQTSSTNNAIPVDIGGQNNQLPANPPKP